MGGLSRRCSLEPSDCEGQKRERKAKKKGKKKKGVGNKGSSPRPMKAPKPQEIAPKNRGSAERPTRKGRERPAAKPPKKTCRKGRKNRYLCCFSPESEMWTGRWLQDGGVSPRGGRPHFSPALARFSPVSKWKTVAGNGLKMAGNGLKMAGNGP